MWEQYIFNFNMHLWKINMPQERVCLENIDVLKFQDKNRQK